MANQSLSRRPLLEEGVRNVTNAERDAVDAERFARREIWLRTEKSCGPDASTLASSRQKAIFAARVARKPIAGEQLC